MENTMSMLGSIQGETTNEKLSLGCRQVYRIQNKGESLRVQGVEGTVYITVADDQGDYFLQPGEQMMVHSRGLVLVQGMPEGAFRYTGG